MNTTEYLLSCLVEECAEVIQRATKAQRFGLSEIQPDQELDNQQRLEAEVSDLMGTLELLREEGIGLIGPSEAIQAKMHKVRKFMDYSREQGALHR
jgi:hypothetical protein